MYLECRYVSGWKHEVSVAMFDCCKVTALKIQLFSLHFDRKKRPNMLRMVLACEKHDPFRMVVFNAPQILDWPWLMGHHVLETHMVNLLQVCLSFARVRVQGEWEACRFKHSAIQHPEISFWTIDVVTCWWVQKKGVSWPTAISIDHGFFPQLLVTLPKTLQITQDFQVQVPKNGGTEPYSRLFWGWVLPFVHPYSLHIGFSYLHFRYPKCLVTNFGATSLFF